MKFDSVPARLKGFNCSEQLDNLEEILKQQKMYPTRREEADKLLDTEWILRVIKYLDPEDQYNIFDNRDNSKQSISRDIDQE